MKKTFPVLVALLSGILLYTSCNKGDDNPYGDWRCTCFVTKYKKVITGSDTALVPVHDTVYLQANDMDMNTAQTFCEQSKKSYSDTLGSSATCNVK